MVNLVSTNEKARLHAFQTLSHELVHVLQNQENGVASNKGIGVNIDTPVLLKNMISNILGNEYSSSEQIQNETEAFHVGYLATKALLLKEGKPLSTISKDEFLNIINASIDSFTTEQQVIDKFYRNVTFLDAAQFSRTEQSQFDQLLAKADKMIAEQGKLLAPNGKPSKLNRYQWAQVRTDNFKAWFGDWENDPANASKVVDENGEPLVMYHGSKATDIVIFDTSSLINKGSYFTKDHTLAQLYANDHLGKVENLKNGGVVYPVFLSIKKPLILKREDKGFWVTLRDRFRKDYKDVKLAEDRRINSSTFLSALAVEKLKNDSLDGIINIELDETITFDPTQIKSAISNNGVCPAPRH
jgi:hypothetical protein